MIEKKLGINISLRGGRLQEQHCFFPVTGNIVTAEIELAKNILGILVILIR